MKVDWHAEEILALLSVARGGATPAHVLERLNSVSQALQRHEKMLAGLGLALVSQPALEGRAAAEALAKTADALQAAVDPRALTKARGIAPRAKKASPDDPKHPGWPAGAPDSQGGRFRPKTPDDYPSGPPKEKPSSPGRMTVVSQF